MGILNREIFITITEMIIVITLVLISIPVWNNVSKSNNMIATADYYSSNSYKNVSVEKIQTQDLLDITKKDNDNTIILLRNITKYNVDYVLYLKLNKMNDHDMYIDINSDTYNLNKLYTKSIDTYNYYKIDVNKLEAHKGKKYDIYLWSNNDKKILTYDFVYEEK